MSDELDDKKEKPTPPAPSADDQSKNNQTPKSGDGSGGTDKDKDSDDSKEHMIPKSRFDEVAAKARLGEQAAAELAELKGRFNAMSDALGGKKNATDEMQGEIKTLADKYGLKDDFVQDLLSLSKAMSKREILEEVKPLKAQQAQAQLQAEFANLEREIPDAKDMTKEEREDLLKMALQPQYHKVPLTDVYKLKNYGKPAGKSKTAEPSRGGGGKADDGEVDIKSMTPQEFEKYSNDLAKKK